jgi:hypothetical protein
MSEQEKIASLTIDGSQAKQELDKLQAGFAKTGASFEKTTKRLAETDSATRRLLTSIPGSSAAVAEMERRTSSLNRELNAGRISADDHAKAVERLKARYTETGQAASKMEAETAKLSAEMAKLNGMFAKFNGNDIAQARSNLINFTQQVATTGQVTSALTAQGPEILGLFYKLPVAVQGAAAGFAAFAVGAGVVAGRVASIADEGRRAEAVIGRLNASMRGFDARGASFEIANAAGVSRGDASAAIDAMVKNRRIQDQALAKSLAQSAVEVSRVIGEDVSKVAAEVAAAFGRGAAGVAELDEELNFLSPSMARYIRELDEAGRKSEAMGKAAEALGGKFNGAAKEMASSWSEAFREVGNGLDQLIEKAAKSDLSQHLARGFGRMGRGIADAARPDDPSVTIMARQRDLARARDVLENLQYERAAGVPLAPGAEAAAAAEVKRLSDEIERLIEVQRRAAAQRDEIKTTGGLAGVSDSERKIIDQMTGAFERESAAMHGNAAERAVALAGLEAERTAREAGRSAAAATEERLLAEARARRDLAVSIEDQLRSQRDELALTQALAAAGGDRRAESAAYADAERRRVLSSGGTSQQADEAAGLSVRRDAAERQRDLSSMALEQRQQIDLLEKERALIGTSNAERAKITAELATQNRLLETGVDLTDAGAKAMAANAGALAEYQAKLAESQEMARSVSGILAGGAEDLFLGLNKSKDVMAEMGERFNHLFVRKAIAEPLDKMLSSALGSMLAPDAPGFDKNNTPTALTANVRGQMESAPLYVQVVNGLAGGDQSRAAEVMARSAGNAAVNNGDIRAMVAAEAQRQGVPVNLALGVARQESNFNQSAVSHAGAMGVMQLMPGTARGLGVDPKDAGQNIAGGVAYFSQMMKRYGGDEQLALLAYNWGPGNVDSWLKTGVGVKGQAMPAEAQNYAPSVLGHAKRFANDNSIMVGSPHRAAPLQNEGAAPGMVYAPNAAAQQQQQNPLQAMLGQNYGQLAGGALNAFGAYMNQPGLSMGGSLVAAGDWKGAGDSLMSLAKLTGIDKALGLDGASGLSGFLDKPLYGGGTPFTSAGGISLTPNQPVSFGNALGGAMSAFSAFQSFKNGNVASGIGNTAATVMSFIPGLQPFAPLASLAGNLLDGAFGERGEATIQQEVA